MREQRQRGRLALDLADQQVDQPRLEPQPGATGGALDGAAQVRLAHRAEQVQAVLEEPRDVRVRRQVAEVVGPQREHQRAAGADVRASAAKYRSRSAGSAQRVTASSAWSTTRVCRPRGFNPPSESIGCAPGVVTRTGVPLRTSDGDDAGADQRGLADAGGPDDRQHARVAEPPQARRDVVLATEERVGVLGVVGQQAAVGAARR